MATKMALGWLALVMVARLSAASSSYLEPVALNLTVGATGAQIQDA